MSLPEPRPGPTGYPILAARGGIAEQDLEMYCKFCDKFLKSYLKGETIFHELTNKCDCSWICCDAVVPTVHQGHLEHRPITEKGRLLGKIFKADVYHDIDDRDLFRSMSIDELKAYIEDREL